MQALRLSKQRWRSSSGHARVCLGAGLGLASSVSFARVTRATQESMPSPCVPCPLFVHSPTQAALDALRICLSCAATSTRLSPRTCEFQIEKCRDRPSYWAVAKAHPVTATILLANVAVFAVDQLLTNGLLVVAGMKSNPAIARGQIYRLLSCTFLHGGLVHLLVRNAPCCSRAGHLAGDLAATNKAGRACRGVHESWGRNSAAPGRCPQPHAPPRGLIDGGLTVAAARAERGTHPVCLCR